MKKYYYTKTKTGRNGTDSVFVIYGEYRMGCIDGLVIYSNVIPKWKNQMRSLFRPRRRDVYIYNTLEDLTRVHMMDFL